MFCDLVTIRREAKLKKRPLSFVPKTFWDKSVSNLYRYLKKSDSIRIDNLRIRKSRSKCPFYVVLDETQEQSEKAMPKPDIIKKTEADSPLQAMTKDAKSKDLLQDAGKKSDAGKYKKTNTKKRFSK
uniref:Uncharacterized protein n=1 Tax=Clastoptera arizonana TaxID=38151 RepID=A0A1B6E7C0_9HEMI